VEQLSESRCSDTVRVAGPDGEEHRQAQRAQPWCGRPLSPLDPLRERWEMTPAVGPGASDHLSRLRMPDRRARVAERGRDLGGMGNLHNVVAADQHQAADALGYGHHEMPRYRPTVGVCHDRERGDAHAVEVRQACVRGPSRRLGVRWDQDVG
jgi:hypothetical protein